jgi:hypothetical protein
MDFLIGALVTCVVGCGVFITAKSRNASTSPVQTLAKFKRIGVSMGLWKFGKKQKWSSGLENVSDTAIEVAAFVVHLQMSPAAGTPGFDDKLNSPFARGYLVGIFAGAMQALNVPGCDDNFKTMAFIMKGHTTVLGMKQGATFALDSTKLQGNPDYDLGNRVGGEELIDYLNQKTKVPLKLFHYLRSS